MKSCPPDSKIGICLSRGTLCCHCLNFKIVILHYSNRGKILSHKTLWINPLPIGIQLKATLFFSRKMRNLACFKNVWSWPKRLCLDPAPWEMLETGGQSVIFSSLEWCYRPCTKGSGNEWSFHWSLHLSNHFECCKRCMQGKRTCLWNISRLLFPFQQCICWMNFRYTSKLLGKCPNHQTHLSPWQSNDGFKK